MFGMIVLKISSTVFASLSHLEFSQITLAFSKAIDVTDKLKKLPTNTSENILFFNTDFLIIFY